MRLPIGLGGAFFACMKPIRGGGFTYFNIKVAKKNTINARIG